MWSNSIKNIYWQSFLLTFPVRHDFRIKRQLSLSKYNTSTKRICSFNSTLEHESNSWDHNCFQFQEQFLQVTTKIVAKGQLISKGVFGILNSLKKWTKKLNFTTMIPQVHLFLFVFVKKLKTPKRHFKINWPLIPNS